MKSNINEEPLKIYANIPKKYGGWENYHLLPETKHLGDGWVDAECPFIDNNTQVMGEPYYDTVNNIVTHHIIEKTVEQIKSEAMQVLNNQRTDALNSIMIKEIENTVQTFNDEEAFENQAVFPLWESYEEEYIFPAEFKLQDFDENNEVKLYKSIQPNNKRENTRPKDYPAGWFKIEFGEGGVEIWSQPIGGDGKYPYLDPLTGLPYRVSDEGQVWENNYQSGLNVWRPGEYGWTLIG